MQRLSPLQRLALREVCRARPHAVPSELGAVLKQSQAVVFHTLDALTRRSLVTPVDSSGGRIVYVPTGKGKLLLLEIATEKAAAA